MDGSMDSTAIDGLMAGTAMDDAMATKWQWMVDGNGRQLTA
jgi:hypothetical protein